MDNRFNKIFPSFDPFNKEFVLGDWLINIFPSHFSLHSTNRQSDKSIKIHIHNLNNISLWVSTDLRYTLIISNANIKNQVATSIVHIHIHDRPIIKTIYHAVNITSTKAKLFALRYGINQTTNLPNIKKSSSLQTLFILQKEYLIHHYTHFKFM